MKLGGEEGASAKVAVPPCLILLEGTLEVDPLAAAEEEGDEDDEEVLVLLELVPPPQAASSSAPAATAVSPPMTFCALLIESPPYDVNEATPGCWAWRGRVAHGAGRDKASRYFLPHADTQQAHGARAGSPGRWTEGRPAGQAGADRGGAGHPPGPGGCGQGRPGPLGGAARRARGGGPGGPQGLPAPPERSSPAL